VSLTADSAAVRIRYIFHISRSSCLGDSAAVMTEDWRKVGIFQMFSEIEMNSAGIVYGI
jgi:phosphatidate phosphatase PAH1